MSGARTAPGLFIVLAAAALFVLAMTAPAAGAQQGQEPRLPRELWKTYPLDPTKGESGKQSTGGGAVTGQRPSATTTTALAPRETPQAEGGSSFPVLLAALGGLAWLLAVAWAVLIAHRRGRLLPRRPRPRRAVMTRRSVGATRSVRGLAPARPLADAEGNVRPPRPRMRQRLRSEAGALAPLAEPSARKKRVKPPEPKRVSPGEAPPKEKPLSSLAPPLAKERHVRSGLPPGKRVPYPAEAPPKEEPTPSAPEPTQPAAALRPLYTAGRLEPRRPGRRTARVRGRVEECEIEWWRGYVLSDFYAFALRPGGPAIILARSPSFRWRHTDPPPHEGPAAEAHTALVERLSARGWEPVGTGGAWYRTRLRRQLKPTLRDFADYARRSAG
jgi:hypothetical protein